jgi:hypothetical protein
MPRLFSCTEYAIGEPATLIPGPLANFAALDRGATSKISDFRLQQHPIPGKPVSDCQCTLLELLNVRVKINSNVELCVIGVLMELCAGLKCPVAATCGVSLARHRCSIIFEMMFRFDIRR